MTSAAATMETPALLPTREASENGEEAKVVVEKPEDPKKKKEMLPPVKSSSSASPLAPPPSGAATASSKAPISIAKSAPSKANENGAQAMDVIDSALLAALRDPRERRGLLKLEQILIDFLEKQPQDSYVDIGGPYNSTVISPTLGYIGQQPQQLQAMAQQQLDGTNAGRPQTTFQRCILHRICDRFNMTRENSYTTDAYGCYLIRVCKGTDSRKPPRRLLNVKESEYQIPRPDNNPSSNNKDANHQLSANFQQMSIASSNSANPTGATNGLSTKGSRKGQKMKIMKRSGSTASSSSSGSNNNNKAKNTVTVKTRSTLSEKERKYAEARARIFEQEGDIGSGNNAENAGESSSSNIGSSSTPVFVPGNYAYNNAKSNTSNDAYGGYNNSDRRGNYNTYNNNANSYNLNRQSSQSPSPSSSISGSATGNPKAPLHTNSTTSLNSMASNNSGKGSSSDNDQQQTTTTTTTTRSKATYRNRQQEETDPDFRRGAGIQLQANPYAQTHAPLYAGGGRGGGNVYYPSNMVTANGTNSRVGYGYGQQQQQQQHYQYHQQQHYAAQQHHQQYYSNKQVGGRGYSQANIQYQQQRRQQEQHYPALSSSTARK